MKMTGSQIIIECLVEQDVDTIFGYPGGAVLNIYDELYKNQDRVKHILTSHEQGASHAADGYARVTGKTGVCLATSGPGATNLVTGIATAYMDSVPMVCITGNVSTDLLGKDSFQEADITGITIPITKNNYIVKNVENLASTIREAFAVAASGRPGPVLVDIPKDVTANVTEFTPATKDDLNKYRKMNNKVKGYSKEDIDKMLSMIDESERPFILCGGGVIRSGASAELLEFAEKINAPVGVTLMGYGGFPGTHPNFTGLSGMHGSKASNKSISECDLLISLGSRFNDRVIGDSSRFGTKAKFIHIDIDMAEIDKNIDTQHHINDDIKRVLSEVNKNLKLKENETWLNLVKSWKLSRVKDIMRDEQELVPESVVKHIYELTNGDAIIVTDVGQHQLWAAKYYPYDKPGRLITSGGFGTMGYGLGAAMGAQIGAPDKTVVHMTGDGSFRMNCNELATVEHYNLPIIHIIFDNRTLGMVRQWQTKFYEKRYSNTDLDRGPDFVKLAEAYNIKGYRVTTNKELKDAFSEALASGKAAVIDCAIGIDEMVVPMVAPGKPITEFVVEEK